MKKLIIIIAVLFAINLAVYIITLFVSEKTMIILYRMALLCNLGGFAPSLTLIYRENKKKK